MSSISSKRNVKIELIRIFACILVIWYHIRLLPWNVYGELRETAVLFESICTVCVVTFFLITGFFIYDRKGSLIDNWLYYLKSFFIKIFPPFVVVSIICIIFHDYLISIATFSDCLRNISIEKICSSLLASFSSFSTESLPGTAAHLWYVYSYFYIILVYPVTYLILKKAPEAFTYVVLIAITILMILNDYYSYYGDSIYYKFFEIVRKPVYYSAVGYVLYHKIMKPMVDARTSENIDKKELIINKKLFVLSIIIYIVTFILLYKTQVGYYLGTNNGYVYTSWLSLYSLILSICFVLIIYNINVDLFVSEKVKKTILFVSSKTLGIYLIHYLIIAKLVSIGFQEFFTKKLPTVFHHFVYNVFYSAFIFTVSFVIIAIIDFIKDKIVGGLYVFKEKRLS
ncbi:MAG: acyltransferase [Lachnospiraceae bacterium]|nr:acyltransferase [Lachnospiraceae bacterium]